MESSFHPKGMQKGNQCRTIFFDPVEGMEKQLCLVRLPNLLDQVFSHELIQLNLEQNTAFHLLFYG